MLLWILPLLVMGGLAAPARAAAQALELRVVPQGALPFRTASPHRAEVRIDFGAVQNGGPQPRVGERLDAAAGSFYVARVELEVGVGEGPRLGARPGAPPKVRGDLPAQPGLGLLGRRADLYASTSGPEGSVRLVVAPQEWTIDGATPMGPVPLPLAHGLAVGDRVVCEIGMFASHAASGPIEAEVRFELR